MSALTVTNILLGIVAVEGLFGLLLVENNMRIVERILRLLRRVE